MLAWIILIGLFTAPVWIMAAFLLFLKRRNNKHASYNTDDDILVYGAIFHD